MRLIDADLLDYEVMNLFITITGNPKQHTVVNECKSSFRRMIEEQPTVEPVRGEWIDTQPEYHHGYGNNTKVCSNCHDYYTKEWEDLYFCPRCGADMRGEKND